MQACPVNRAPQAQEEITHEPHENHERFGDVGLFVLFVGFVCENAGAGAPGVSPLF